MEYKKLAESMSDSAKISCNFGERILLTSGSEAIKDLLSTVEELEAKNKRLEQARENANAACAKWEGLYLAKLEKKPAWISVRDMLPEKGVCVLVRAKTKFAAGESICIDRLEDGEKRPVWFYTHGWYEVTHWMHLPEPPKEE